MIIQKGLALFLWVVFALSITPKPFFHDVLADHKDEQVCRDKDKSSPHFHKPASHCSFDDLVVSAPFLIVPQAFAPEPLQRAGHFSELIPSFVCSLACQATESRGPPSI